MLCSSAAQNLLSCTLLSAMLHTVDHLPYIHEAAATPITVRAYYTTVGVFLKGI